MNICPFSLVHNKIYTLFTQSLWSGSFEFSARDWFKNHVNCIKCSTTAAVQMEFWWGNILCLATKCVADCYIANVCGVSLIACCIAEKCSYTSCMLSENIGLLHQITTIMWICLVFISRIFSFWLRNDKSVSPLTGCSVSAECSCCGFLIKIWRDQSFNDKPHTECVSHLPVQSFGQQIRQFLFGCCWPWYGFIAL